MYRKNSAVEVVPTPGWIPLINRSFVKISDLTRKKADSLAVVEKAQKKGPSPVFQKKGGQPATAMSEKSLGEVVGVKLRCFFRKISRIVPFGWWQYRRGGVPSGPMLSVGSVGRCARC
jgi:hypothetical protein